MTADSSPSVCGCGRPARRRLRPRLLCGYLVAAFLSSPAAASTVASPKAASPSARKLARSAAGLEEESPIKHVERGLPRAIALAKLEQELEDANVMLKFDRKIERNLMVMPLTEQFEPPIGHYAYGHMQTGDKVSMPKSVFMEIMRQNLEVPFQFEIARMERKGPGRYEPVEWKAPQAQALEGAKEMPPLPRIFCSVLDVRSPEQYLFLPDWLMKAQRLKPRDIVRLRFSRLPSGGLVRFQPHTSAFTKLSNHQAVLEMELKHYSCLTRGSTISFNYRGQRYDFNVVDCKDTDGKPQEAVCVQDSDVATDFLPALDTPAARRKVKTALAAAKKLAGDGGSAEEGASDDVEEGAGSSEAEEEPEGSALEKW